MAKVELKVDEAKQPRRCHDRRQSLSPAYVWPTTLEKPVLYPLDSSGRNDQ
jgi:hypothetical protein